MSSVFYKFYDFSKNRVLKKTVACCFIFLLFFSAFAIENSGKPKKILFIGSGEADSYMSSTQIQGLKEELGDDFFLSYQFMEMNKGYDDEKYSHFYACTKEYIKNNDFDLFITADDDACNFSLLYRKELFADKPVVFLGVEDAEIARQAALDGNITGVKDVLYFDENVLLAKRLFPDVKRIYLITDNTYLGKMGSSVFYDLPMRFKGIEFTEINTSAIKLEQFENQLENLTSGDVVFYLSSKDTQDGIIYDKSQEILQSCLKKTIPVFNCTYTGTPRKNFSSFIGGYYSSYLDMGLIAGKMVKEICNGIDIRYLSITSDCPAHYYFDFDIMKKFDLRKNQLPNDTIYFNDADSLSKAKKVWFLFIALLISVIIIGLAFNSVELKNKQHLFDLLQENRRMLHAVMDQSETLYWECDFSKDTTQKPELIQEKNQNDEVEELESVPDDTPLGRVDDVEPVELVELENDVEYFNKNEFNLRTEDVVLGWIYSGVIQREYREQFHQMLSDFRNGKTKKSIEIDIPIGIRDIQNNIQTERWKHIVYRAIKTEGDKVIRAICSATDVTSQKRAEREYEGIMKYQSFVQQSYPAYTRINLTKNAVLERFINVLDIGKYIKGNTALSELEFIREIITTRNQNRSFASTLDREELIIAFKNGARQRECDFCYKFSNNALHWFNLCIELASNPSTGDIEAYCYLKDITSQKISAITKDSVLNEDVEYIFWLNKNTKECQFINKSESASWISESDTIEYDNFISILLKKKIPASDKEKIKDDFNIEKIEEQLLTTSEVRFTYHTRKEDGSIEIKQEKVYYLEKEANILIYVCTDITAITMMENQQNEKLALAIKQAEKANASKSDFLSRMSHDLRTPMNGIMGIAELASKELDDPEALERDIQKIRSSSSYMLGLLNDILDMSKIESGKLEIHQTKASAGNCLENIITLAHVMCDKKNITFYCNKNPDKYRDYIINVDVLHIQQVAMNLISNASKFTPPGGRIEFLLDATLAAKDRIHLVAVVRDTGVGMTSEFQKIMYEAFTQDSNSVNKVGTGLGLTIVHSLIDLMGGTIDCVSAPGEGTEFTINIDIEKPEILEDEEFHFSNDTDLDISVESSDKAVQEVSVKGKRALLVEDDELNQEIASRLLMNEGMKVEIAGNGLEALNMFSESEPNYYDIVLMDIMMPVMDGFQSTHLLRTLDREDAKKVPIIAMSANAFTEDIERCIEAGMNAHIAKPIETEKMFKTIKENLKK